MEEHPVTLELQRSRAMLRAMLLPDPETGRIEADVFPRSAVMRFLFNSRQRKLATAGIGAVAMLARMRRGRVGSWAQVVQALGAVLASRRR